MTSTPQPSHRARRIRSIILSVLGLALVAAAIIIWATKGSIVLAVGLAAIALLTFALAPAIIGRPAVQGSGSAPSMDPAELKRWREEHPGTSISDAVNAHR